MNKTMKSMILKILVISLFMIIITSFGLENRVYAYEYNKNILVNPEPSSESGWTLDNCSYDKKNKEFKGDNNDVFTANQLFTLTSSDQIRADKGLLTVSASAELWSQRSVTRYMYLKVHFYRSDNTYMGTKQLSPSHGSWETLSFTNHTVPVGTGLIRYEIECRDSLAGYPPAARNFFMSINDSLAPAYSSTSTNTASKTYPAGTTIRYSVNFNEPIGIVVSSGTFTTNLGTATYKGLSSDKQTMYYDYTIPTTGTVSNYNPVKMTNISGLQVKDDAGNVSDKVTKNLTDNYGIYTDNQYPSVSSFITEASANSYFVAGEEIKFNVTFDEYITVSGSPYISLSNGKRATYKEGTTSDTALATFIYTVGNGDTNTTSENPLKITGIDFTGIIDKVNQSATSSSNYSTNKYNTYLGTYNLGIDTTAPEVEFIDPTTAWHKTDYKVIVVPTDNLSGIKELFSVWTSSSSNTTPTFPSSSNVSGTNEISNPSTSGEYYLWIKAVDKAGNVSSTKSPHKYKFDLVPPAITINPSYISGYSAISKVEVNVTDSHSGVATKKYVWKDLEGTTVAQGSLNDAIIYPGKDGTYSLTVTATDNVGNISTETKNNISIDKTGPVVTFTPNGNTTRAKSSSVSIAVSDEKTGIASYQYAWTDSIATPESEWAPTNLLSFTTPSGKSGAYYLHIKALDKAGNESTTVSGGFNIDNEPPTVEITPNGNSDDIGQSEYKIGVIVSDLITPTLDLKISYVFSSSESWTELEFINLESQTVKLSDFTEITYLYVKAIDQAGNITLFKSEAFIADTIGPTGSITNRTGGFINKALIDLEFQAYDDYTIQDEIMMQLSIDGIDEEWESFSLSKSVAFESIEATYEITVKFKDRSGNISETYSTSFIYDITPPEINIEYDFDAPTNANVTAMATSLDSIEGDSSHIFTENGSFTFKAYDRAGNTFEKNAVVTWIDKTPPTINFSSSEFDNNKYQSANITINCEDNANGIAEIMFRIVKDGQEAEDWRAGNNGETIAISEVDDGKYYIEAKALDGVGNQAIKSSNYVYIDVTKPIATINYSPGNRTAQNVEAVITFDEVVTITNNGGRNTYTFTDNGDFTFEFEDGAGNFETATAKVSWIDRDKPEATILLKYDNSNGISQEQWVNHDLFVTIIPPAQSIINDLTFNGDLVSDSSSVEDRGNNEYLVSQYGEFKFIVHDTDTLLESQGSITVRIDKDIPEFSSEMRTTRDWTNEDVVVTITAYDDLSTVTYVNGNSHKFTENGSHTFNFIDSAGNSNSYTAEVTNIDKDLPIANISYTVGGNPYDGGYINKNIIAKVDFDSLSPVRITNNGTNNEYTFTSNGEFTFEYIDAAGNQASKKIVIDKIDKKPPIAYLTYNNQKWTNNDVIATLHVSDDWSGAVNNGETYTFYENGDHEFIAKDNAGNTTTITASTRRIDKIPPTLSYSLSPSGKTPFSVFATVSADERVTWLNNGGRPSMQFVSNGSFVFRAQDYAGNISEIEVEVNNITRESTPVTLEYSKTKLTNEDVYATIHPQDKENDIIFVMNNDNSKVYKFEKNGEFTFNYRNPSGISGQAVASVSNIDKTPAVVNIEYSTTNLTKDNVVATLSGDKDLRYPFAALNGKYIFTKNDKVEIPVTDMAGNKTYILLQVNWIDKDAPKIELDNQYEAIGKGSIFNVNEGISVTDDNDIPNGIKITGIVDTSTLGDYEILYTATDEVGNTSEITKYVTVYDPNAFNLVINGRMPVNSEVEISVNDMTIETINQSGNLKLLCSPGKKDFGYFKKNGYKINKQYTFEQKGYYTIYLQDQNRNTKLVYVFVK